MSTSLTETLSEMSARALQCPYPGCDGALPADLAEEVALCPACCRVSARCPRLGKQGRCATLNRTLARWCRHCRQELGPGWAQALWADDAGGRPAAAPLRLEPALRQPDCVRRVLCLNDHLRCELWDNRPLGLAQAGRWLWLGGPDGRSLFLDPFHDFNGAPPVLSEQLWPGVARARLRLRAGGVWTLVYSEHGVKAVNLLALDEPGRADAPALDLWQAGEERLLSNPVLLRDSRNGLERLAAWLTGGPAGLTLWAAPLLVTYGRAPAPRRYALDDGGNRLRLEESGGRLALVEAPFEDRDGLILAAPQGLWLLDPAAARRKATTVDPPGADGRRLLPAVRLLEERTLRLHTDEMPGVVFAPGGDPGQDEPCGSVAVAAAGAGGVDELCSVLVSRRGALSRLAHANAGVPLDAVTLGGRRLVLCRAGRRLVLSDLVGREKKVAASDLLPWVMRAHAYGRVAVLSGREATEGRRRWFVQLLDLGQENAVIDQGIYEALPAHPVLLGRYLFGIEAIEEEGQPRLWLTRRRLA
jgi:hypothetical protein